MGAPPAEPGQEGRDTRREVTIGRAFEIYSTEVTNSEFEALMPSTPRRHKKCGGDCPVVHVSWDQAAVYCNKLSESRGYELCYSCKGSNLKARCTALKGPNECEGYRLPTEAEWEYAARAATTTATFVGEHTECDSSCWPNSLLDSYAWFCGNSGFHPHDVGTKSPNPWGLYDMLGNASEWCHDQVQGSCVVRGGSFESVVCSLRAAQRGLTIRDPSRWTGFRPVRTLFQ